MEFIETAVETAADEEFVVGAGVDDLSMVNDDNQVGVAHGGETMRDNQCRAIGEKIGDRAAYGGFGFGVE